MDDTQNDLIDAKPVDNIETPSPGAEAAGFSLNNVRKEAFLGGGEGKTNNSVIQTSSAELKTRPQREVTRMQQLRQLLRGERPMDIRFVDGRNYEVTLSRNPRAQEVREALKQGGAEDYDRVHTVTPTKLSAKEQIKDAFTSTFSFVKKQISSDFKTFLVRSGRPDLAELVGKMSFFKIMSKVREPAPQPTSTQKKQE